MTAGFDLFWQSYPRKVAKGLARRSWASATTRAPSADILAGLSAQLAAGVFDGMKEDARRKGMQEKTLIPHPSTWLTGDRWEDEIEPRCLPVLHNGAAELLLREAEMWPLIDGTVENVLEGPAGD